MLAEDLKNGPFWPKNHFFTITTPKPSYIYPNNFSIENFSKKNFGPQGPSLGYLGSLSQKWLGTIFSKCVFLNLLSPLGFPLPSNALGSSKKLKIFPRGCSSVSAELLHNSLLAALKETCFRANSSPKKALNYCSRL